MADNDSSASSGHKPAGYVVITKTTRTVNSDVSKPYNFSVAKNCPFVDIVLKVEQIFSNPKN